MKKLILSLAVIGSTGLLEGTEAAQTKCKDINGVTVNRSGVLSYKGSHIGKVCRVGQFKCTAGPSDPTESCQKCTEPSIKYCYNSRTAD